MTTRLQPGAWSLWPASTLRLGRLNIQVDASVSLLTQRHRVDGEWQRGVNPPSAVKALKPRGGKHDHSNSVGDKLRKRARTWFIAL